MSTVLVLAVLHTSNSLFPCVCVSDEQLEPEVEEETKTTKKKTKKKTKKTKKKTKKTRTGTRDDGQLHYCVMHV